MAQLPLLDKRFTPFEINVAQKSLAALENSHPLCETLFQNLPQGSSDFRWSSPIRLHNHLVYSSTNEYMFTQQSTSFYTHNAFHVIGLHSGIDKNPFLRT